MNGPSLVKTRFSEVLWKDPVLAEAAAKSTPLGHLAVPEDITGVALFLASDASSYVTAETIIVDGGGLVGPPPSFPA